VYQETHKRMMTSLNDPKLNQLIDELVELRTKHEELEDERHSLSYKIGDLDYDDYDEDLMDEYQDLQYDIEVEMSNVENLMKRLIEDYIH